ncbi:MAG: type III secretion system export apparatus subunit SctV [Chitinophagaceae bacterium]
MSFINKITQIALAASKKIEIVAAFFIVAIVFMMILPLPIWLVDILIALNISLACLLVIISLYLSGPLAFSTFPAVLLLTTLFRLALEVATTRLILLDGDAGHIVEAFGQFVVGGNLVVGLVIFLILTVVQFLVITKGSERVAEVSARFTLDAMPGKQMSIDNDLRSNVINGEEARRRRNDLARESQLFGAMDGAMKFVKGDSIAGIIIVAINLLGGIAIGVLQKDMTAADSLRKYAILTIGDGLIAQIPSILISLTAGMIITRVANNASQGGKNDSNVGKEVIEQIFGQPRSLYIASGTMLMFAAIPSMPYLIFISLAAITASIAYLMNRVKSGKGEAENNKTPSKRQPRDEHGQVMDVVKDAKTFTPIREYVIAFGSIWSKPAPAHPDIIEVVNSIRSAKNHLVQDFGFLMPKIHVDFSPSVEDNQYIFQIYEVPTLSGTLHLNKYLCLNNASVLDALHVPYQIIDNEPIGTTQLWVEDSHLPNLMQAGVKVKSFNDFLTFRLLDYFLRTCKQFFGIEEMQRVSTGMDELMPELSKELQRSIPIPKITEVFQRLCAERVSVRNVRQIYETLVEWGAKERDPVVLAEYVRMSLRRQICHQFSQNGLLLSFLITPETEEVIRGAIRQNSHGSFLALDPPIAKQFLQKVSEAYKEHSYDIIPPIILASQDIRRYVRKLIEDEYFTIPVISFSELSADMKVQPIGKISLEDE